MAHPIVADAEDFARALFRLVEHRGRRGEPVAQREVLEKTIAALPEHPYVRYIQEKPARRARLAEVAERIRAAEFPHIERLRDGTRRGAPVYFKLPPPCRELTPADPAAAPTPPPEAAAPTAGPATAPPSAASAGGRAAADAALPHDDPGARAPGPSSPFATWARALEGGLQRLHELASRLRARFVSELSR